MSDRFLDMEGLYPDEQEAFQEAVDCVKNNGHVTMFDRPSLVDYTKQAFEKGQNQAFIIGGLSLIATGVILNHKKEIAACFSKVGRMLFGKK